MTDTSSAPAKSAPRISFVSLGCPKALVDSERILTQLRAEGYELSRQPRRRRRGHRQHLRLPRQRQEGIAGGDRRRDGGKRQGDRHRLHGRRARDRSATPSRTSRAITGPQAYESVMAAVHAAAPAPHDPFVDLIPEQGVKLTPRHYAYLKISEGCNNRCTFCIIPKLRGDLVSRPAAEVLREAEKLVKAGVKELLVISQDTSAYGLDIRYAESAWRDKTVARRRIPRSDARAWDAGRLGAAALCLSLSACRRGHRTDERRQCAALYRRAVPARRAARAEGDAPPRQSGKDAGAHPRLARDLPGSDHPLDLHRRLSRRDRGGLPRSCSTGSTKPSSTASAPSNTSRSQARAPTTSASTPVPAEVKESRWRRFMERAQAISAKRLAAKVGKRIEVIVDEGGAPRGQGPLQGRCAGDRRRGAYRNAPAAARRRHRQRQGRARRRL